MAKLTLSKSSLLSETRKLANYERFLPSLDLKRKQLIIESSAAEARLRETKQKLEKLDHNVAGELQMLANREINLNDLVVVDSIEREDENLLGISLPVIIKIHFTQKSYGFLTRPHWVDLLVKRLREAAELHLQLKNDEQRLAILRLATRKATQRVNLVGKVLVPQAKNNIRKIRIYLSDNERAAVVRSKIAKRKHARQNDDYDSVSGAQV